MPLDINLTNNQTSSYAQPIDPPIINLEEVVTTKDELMQHIVNYAAQYDNITIRHRFSVLEYIFKADKNKNKPSYTESESINKQLRGLYDNVNSFKHEASFNWICGGNIVYNNIDGYNNCYIRLVNPYFKPDGPSKNAGYSLAKVMYFLIGLGLTPGAPNDPKIAFIKLPESWPNGILIHNEYLGRQLLDPKLNNYQNAKNICQSLCGVWYPFDDLGGVHCFAFEQTNLVNPDYCTNYNPTTNANITPPGYMPNVTDVNILLQNMTTSSTDSSKNKVEEILSSPLKLLYY